MYINKAYSIASTMFLTKALPCHEQSMDWEMIDDFIRYNLSSDFEDFEVGEVWDWIATIGALIFDAYKTGKNE